MADSNITKRALASSLKELMETMPFEKINVGDICEKCDMNRKSFYYHFKDKYDLVNWIFDTECVPLMLEAEAVDSPADRYRLLAPCAEYLYNNRDFYRKALKIQGQNAFSDHMREFMLPTLKARLSTMFEEDAIDDFTLNFFSDAVLSSMQRWLGEKDCMRWDEFLKKMYTIIYRGAHIVYEKLPETEDISEGLPV